MIYSFPPIFNKNSKILILGSMASVKSLEYGFFYMHPQNRFWKTVTEICGRNEVPQTHEGKRQMLLDNKIALCDILISCEREGSLDSDIKNYTVRDIPDILAQTKISRIFNNGKKSWEIARKYFPRLDFNYLPSTSPANNVNFKKEEWLKLKNFL